MKKSRKGEQNTHQLTTGGKGIARKELNGEKRGIPEEEKNSSSPTERSSLRSDWKGLEGDGRQRGRHVARNSHTGKQQQQQTQEQQEREAEQVNKLDSRGLWLRE